MESGGAEGGEAKGGAKGGAAGRPGGRTAGRPGGGGDGDPPCRQLRPTATCCVLADWPLIVIPPKLKLAMTLGSWNDSDTAVSERPFLTRSREDLGVGTSSLDQPWPRDVTSHATPDDAKKRARLRPVLVPGLCLAGESHTPQQWGQGGGRQC